MARKIVAVGIWAFALGSFVFWLISSIGRDPGETKAATQTDRTAVYYLHGKKRCRTCNRMERLTKEALQETFAPELRSGRIEFTVANFAIPENQRFVDTYGIYAAAVVVEKVKGGEIVRGRNLEWLWDHKSSAPVDFKAYIRKEIEAFRQGVEFQTADADEPLTLWLLVLGSLGLGLLTAISPCPLATNLAAVSFLSRDTSRPRRVIAAGILYALGRILAYMALGALLVFGLLSVPAIANFLNAYVNALLGPLLLIAGLLLLELIQFSTGPLVKPETLQRWSERAGLWSAVGLGFLFALAFCPTSAALFFGGLIPLATKHQSAITAPTLYGLATGLPVVLLALLLAVSAKKLGDWFNRLSAVDIWLRRGTGMLFLLVGLYYCLVYIYEVI